MIDTKQLQAMAELRRALQIFATTLYADDEAAMQITSWGCKDDSKRILYTA